MNTFHNYLARQVQTMLLIFCFLLNHGHAQTIEWLRQFGSSEADASYGLSVDGSGNIYLTGSTYGELNGPNLGKADSFLSKFTATGDLEWTRQLGTERTDFAQGVSADVLGNVFVTGRSVTNLVGPSSSDADAHISKYDESGNLQWTREFGTDFSDSSYGVSSDGLGNVYVGGGTSGDLMSSNAGGFDAFIRKYDTEGRHLWTRQFGTNTSESITGVSSDASGNVYVSGWTFGSLGGPSSNNSDAFISKFDDTGNLLWTRQLGTTRHDHGNSVSADHLGNVFISGWAGGKLGGTSLEPGGAFIAKYDSDGNLEWTRQLEGQLEAPSYSVSADGLGNAYITGWKFGNFSGPNTISPDAFISKYDNNGDRIWTFEVGTDLDDVGHGVASDGEGNVYFSGYTLGDLGGTSYGDYDVFIVKVSDFVVPEPPPLIMVALIGTVAAFTIYRPRPRTP